ncbi:MAG: ABC transporter substrate-binding protein [Dehalococcoidia bacterium]
MAQHTTWQREAAHRFTRRRVLGATAIGGTAAFLAACGGDDKTSDSGSSAQQAGGTSGAGSSGTVGGGGVALDAKTEPVTGKESIEELRERFHGRNLKQLPGQANGPKYGGTLRWPSNVPTTWDLAGPAASTLASWAMFHNKLVDFEMGDLSENLNLLKLTTDLAQSWEQPDSQTFTFKLQPGVKWANMPPVNGRAFSAEDIKYAVEAYQKAPVQSSIYRDVAAVETPDATTVVFRMKQPAAYFLRVMAQPMNLIFSREQHQSADGLKGGPVGTGPFIYEDGQDRVGWKARKNPDYFKKDPFTGKQLPYVDRIETQYFADSNAQIAAFRDKQVDVLWAQNRQMWMDVLKTNPEVITQFTTPPPSAQPYFAWRNDKPPFNDVRVRRALSLAINREDILFGPFDGLAGYGYAQDPSFFGQEWPWTAEQVGEYANFDVAEAKKLLQAAGVGSGLDRKIEIYHIGSTGVAFDVTTLVADMWKKNLGIDVVETVPPDSAAWQDKFFGKKYDDVIMAWYAGPSLDPDAYAYDPLHSKSTKNYFKVNDPELDRLTEAQRVELDVPKRQQLLKEIMERDLDQAYRLWTLNGYKINVRYPNLYNAVDQVHAWGPVGWGSKVVEMVWIDQ